MASADRTPLTPQQRLALSRRALVRQLNGGGEDAHDAFLNHAPASAADDDLEYAHHDAAQAGHAERHQPNGAGGGVWVPLARSIVQRWWRRHPAHAAGQLARPMLEHYARKQPAKLMAVAAATGAVLVLVKPWRLLSVTAVLAAVLKTSDVADIVNTLMQKNPSPPRKDPP
ncbi:MULTISPECIES: hypothetical protein [Variovorax]|uniref:hypothetical protein n=1 Tax=Variovorax TaxID=34072 RepID=UPI00086F2A61|nr:MULTISPECIES: hypothetical protein [Variovorax]MBN8756473.1 hypothetical protein [Variovorax sp.]ODU13562.1 MAG: hypothetical protein ABS94_26555 [Variovorax sp. SCN 67-85]ODV25034.1 MAG: hypothetical protein ABT25_12345 [Variovorax sp. SCN 67-20]OJZ11136.1 MAG: hypothetical protein BGP22_18235 [Variovorax sp. 67-131]UKI06445.1 hypothetical protein L3V85_27030 [Variovorax paradoxus]